MFWKCLNCSLNCFNSSWWRGSVNFEAVWLGGPFQMQRFFFFFFFLWRRFMRTSLFSCVMITFLWQYKMLLKTFCQTFGFTLMVSLFLRNTNDSCVWLSRIIEANSCFHTVLSDFLLLQLIKNFKSFFFFPSQSINTLMEGQKY